MVNLFSWSIVRALCQAELEALARISERDEGDTGTPTAGITVNVQPPESAPERVSFERLARRPVEGGVAEDGE